MMTAVFEKLAELVNADTDLVRRGRWLTTTFLLGADDDTWLVRVVEGRVERVERGPFLMRAWSFAIRASREAWERFCDPTPAPGYQDVFAMTRNGAARVEGDLQPLMTHLRYVQEVLASLRRARPAPAPPVGAGEDVRIEPIAGRYLHMPFQGRPHRIYFEEAGRGVPLVCLHTAGADGRQYRHLLNDDAITAHFRVIAFDMPWHGKSLPPAGWERGGDRVTP